MDLEKLYEILAETTCQLRKGDVFEGTPALVEAAKAGTLGEANVGGVLEIFDMPSVDEAPADIEMVDVEFMKIGVDKAKAEARKADLIDILHAYPEPERLARGPSYIEVGAEIGDQGATFQLFALGKVLGFWSVITPVTFGITGALARELAGGGLVMISGWRP